MSQGQTAPPRRAGCLTRALYVVFLGILTFGLAAGTFYFLWYRPVAEELAAAREELEELRPLEAEVADLQSQLEQASLRLLVLQALVDVNAARASLALGQRQEAGVSMSSAGVWLEQLDGEVSPEHASDVGQMRDRLGLALGELASDAFAAQSDLDVLANDLSQLAERLAEQ